MARPWDCSISPIILPAGPALPWVIWFCCLQTESTKRPMWKGKNMGRNGFCNCCASRCITRPEAFFTTYWRKSNSSQVQPSSMTTYAWSAWTWRRQADDIDGTGGSSLRRRRAKGRLAAKEVEEQFRRSRYPEIGRRSELPEADAGGRNLSPSANVESRGRRTDSRSNPLIPESKAQYGRAAVIFSYSGKLGYGHPNHSKRGRPYRRRQLIRMNGSMRRHDSKAR